jgi:hypothetical protein
MGIARAESTLTTVSGAVCRRFESCQARSDAKANDYPWSVASGYPASALLGTRSSSPWLGGSQRAQE